MESYALTRGYIINELRKRANCDLEEMSEEEAIAIWIKRKTHSMHMTFLPEITYLERPV